MREVWHRLGRTDAINWIVITVVATLQFVGSFVITNSDYSGRETLFLACVVLSVLVVVAMLLLTRYVLIPLVPVVARPPLILAMFQATAVARALVFDWLLVSLDLSDNDQLASRLYGSQFNIFVAGIVVSSLVSMARDFSESNAQLSNALVELRATRESVGRRLKERQLSLVSSIRSQLNTAISSLGGKNATSDARSLTSLIDDVVRPISHRLGREFHSPENEVPSPTPTPIRWSTVIRGAFASNPIHPLWMSVWTAFVTLQVIATAAGPQFWLPYISSVLGFAVWFLSAKFVWKQMHTWFDIPGRALTFSLLVMATPLVVNLPLQMIFGLPFFNPRVVVSAAVYFLVMAWALALVVAAANLLRSTNGELMVATHQLRRRLVSDNVTARHFEQAVSHLLHGPIQDAIAASLRRIQAVPADSRATTSEGAIIRKHIEEALQLLDKSDERHYSVEKAVQELSELWSEVVEIDFECVDSSAQRIEKDQTASSIAIEVIREAVSNAIRHGDATRINVTVQIIEPPSDVHISVANNGAPLSPKATPGLGSRLLDDMTVSWSRDNRDGLVVLHAVIPLRDVSA